MMVNNAIVFLPGWGFKSSIWHDVCYALPAYNHTTLDYPTTIQPNDTLETITNQIDAAITEPCTLVAWSYGGLIATLLCHRSPEKYQRLITVASAPSFPVNKTTIQFKQGMKIDPITTLTLFLRQCAFPSTDRHYREKLQSHLLTLPDKSILLFYLDLLFSSDVSQQSAELAIPTLHIRGERDVILPTNGASGISIIPGAGHIPFYSHRDLFLAHLRHFFAETAACTTPL